MARCSHYREYEHKPVDFVTRLLTPFLVAAAIATVFEAATAGKTATGREGYYFAGS